LYFGRGARAANTPHTVIGCKIPRKENSQMFRFFVPPPLPVSPGLPEVDPTIDKSKRSEQKNWVDLNCWPGLPEKRQARAGYRVNRKSPIPR